MSTIERSSSSSSSNYQHPTATYSQQSNGSFVNVETGKEMAREDANAEFQALFGYEMDDLLELERRRADMVAARGGVQTSTAAPTSGATTASNPSRSIDIQAATDFSQPFIPYTGDREVSDHDVRTTLDNAGDTLSTMAECTLALFELLKSAQKESDFKRELRNMKQESQLQFKEMAIGAAETKLKHERAQLWVDFAVTAAIAIISIAASAVAPQAAGATQAAGQAASAGAKAASAQWGFQRKANDEGLRERRLEILATRAEQMTKEYDESREKAAEELKMVRDIINEHYKLQTQDVNKANS